MASAAPLDPALTGCRLMVATPIYAAAQGTYVRSALALALAAQARGIVVDFAFILHQPSINRARNMLAQIFLASDFTHMLFVDSDIDFSADDVYSMVSAMVAHPECAILGGPVPKRSIAWANVEKASRAGLGQGNPADLARYAGDFTFSFVDSVQSFALDTIVELTRIGTGLMLIRRDVIETLCARHPELLYRPDADERRGYGLGEQVHALFQSMIEPETRHMLSDDYAFCRRARDAGFRVWLAPWVRTSHSGPATFSGSLADLAPLFSSPTASPE
jgi:hypothetical protein